MQIVRKNRKEVIKLFLNQNFGIGQISETHFVDKNCFRIPKYKLYNTNHPDGIAHGGSATFTKERIEHYELLKCEEDSFQAMSIIVKVFPCEITVTAFFCPLRHNLKM